MGLSAPILETLEREGYTIPTPIQIKAIPPVLGGSDLMGIAQTGTGKTAAFALPILHHLATHHKAAPRKGARALILTPTRELASQIAQSFRVYGKNLDLSVAIVFGGVAPRPQIRMLAQGVDILIATPGRLLDHIGAGVANLANTGILVLDEADQMLDMGFVKPIRNIVSQLPANRQTLFFSATMPREITRLAQEFLNDPVKVAVTPVASTAERINQRVIHIETQKKRTLLTEILGNSDVSHTLIFTRTKRGADMVARHLEISDINAAVIHGNKSQRQREQALDAFRKSKIRVLVATDIAARGIDIDDVSHVINFELPEIPESYVHRIGRTARAGASGSAISLCGPDERKHLRAIERLIRQTIANDDRRNDDSIAVDVKLKKIRGTGKPKRHAGRKPRDEQAEGGSDRRSKRRNPRRKKQLIAANQNGDGGAVAVISHGADKSRGNQGNDAKRGQTGKHKPRGQRRSQLKNSNSNHRKRSRAKSA